MHIQTSISRFMTKVAGVVIAFSLMSNVAFASIMTLEEWAASAKKNEDLVNTINPNLTTKIENSIKDFWKDLEEELADDDRDPVEMVEIHGLLYDELVNYTKKLEVKYDVFKSGGTLEKRHTDFLKQIVDTGLALKQTKGIYVELAKDGKKTKSIMKKSKKLIAKLIKAIDKDDFSREDASEMNTIYRKVSKRVQHALKTAQGFNDVEGDIGVELVSISTELNQVLNKYTSNMKGHIAKMLDNDVSDSDLANEKSAALLATNTFSRIFTRIESAYDEAGAWK